MGKDWCKLTDNTYHRQDNLANVHFCWKCSNSYENHLETL